MLVRVRRKGNPCTLVAENVICVATTENSMEIPQKTTFQSSNYTSEDKPKETKSLNLS